jgi:hypothetical protein
MRLCAFSIVRFHSWLIGDGWLSFFQPQIPGPGCVFLRHISWKKGVLFESFFLPKVQNRRRKLVKEKNI